MANGNINPKTGRRFNWTDPVRQKQEAARVDRKAARDIEQELALLLRLQRAHECRDDLLKFTQFTTPDPQDPGNIDKSTYEAAMFHRAVAKHLEEVERGDIRQLIFCMPPRHGKTALATKSFAAWYSGKHPEHDVAVASYSDTMANDFGADTRFIMLSKPFGQVFPQHKLRRGGTAKDNIQTTRGGRLVYVGRGGALTGRGANCVAGGTLVESSRGPLPVEAVVVGDEVLSYDERTGQAVWKKVEAVAHRPKAGLLRVATADGRVVEATGDHRFYSGGAWRKASELAAGDHVVLSVRRDSHPARLRRPEERTSGADKVLLLQQMLGRWGERLAVWRANVRSLRQPCAKANFLWQSGQNILLASVSAGRAGGGVGGSSGRAHEAVCSLQRDVCAVQCDESVLRPELRVEGARQSDARRREPALEGWRSRQSRPAACDAALSRASTTRLATGWRAVLSMLWARAIGGSPHRRECAQQQGEQPGDAVQKVSRDGTFFATESGVVASVEDLRRDAFVFDIQVAETECFFANGVLVHNCLLIDDLFKDFEEARSQAIRDQAWNWFTKVAMTRRMGLKLVVITMTRWHSDDIIGRLTDPENPFYNAEEAKNWKIIRFPAVAEEDDPLQRAPGDALWPSHYDLDFLRSQQRLDPLGFAALYQQRPTVADGVLFRRECIQYYDKLPENLRYYASSDHAVDEKQRNDPSCLLKIGVDAQDNIYIVECDWRRIPTDVAVEAMLAMGGGTMKPLLWWAERGHISKSIGPFLRKRMLETGKYINVVEVTPIGDKTQRAQSIAARVAMGKVFFPRVSSWTERAVDELLAFPNGTHDDFVDALAYIGLGLESQFGRKHAIKAKTEPAAGSLAFMRANDKTVEASKRAAARGGF